MPIVPRPASQAAGPIAAGLVCDGCGHEARGADGEPSPFACPNARPADDVDHVVRRWIAPAEWRTVDHRAAHPFVRFRHRLYAYQLAIAGGLGDTGFVSAVEELDAAVARVWGHGFEPTPFAVEGPLGVQLGFGDAGAVWVKHETGNVSGSHKGRHLFGIMLYLQVVHRLRERALPAGTPPAAGDARTGTPSLAIASCGNAALAAAVVARAAGMPLDVFVPVSADRHVLGRLTRLNARVSTCERRPGEAGDPCYLRFREAVAAGAIPFCCQGPDNGLTIEGGETLAYEMLDVLGHTRLDRIFVQVGGGAFASAVVRAFREAVEAGRLERVPRIHAVQTEGGFPLARAWDRLTARLIGADAAGRDVGAPEAAGGALDVVARARRADRIAREATPAALEDAVRYAATHRDEFMWPWEPEPHSIAHGILDDETYDWLAVVEGMLLGGGWPVVVSEEDLRRANEIGREATGVDVDHTGSAGLAGLVHLLDRGDPLLALAVRGEQVAVVFSGIRRS